MTFEPSAERGARLDLRMRERLADTLDYVFGEVGEELSIGSEDRNRLISDIRSREQSPNRFGAYYEMVLALEDDDVDEARAIARELVDAAVPDGLKIAGIDDRNEAEAARYRRLLMPDPDLVGAPDAEMLSQTRSRIGAAFEMLDRGFPEMAGEIRALLREIVIAAGPKDPKALTFDGASSYMLWGATLLNARGQTNVLDTAQALAHESGHNLLFGFCVSGPLVDNPDDELFSSPLRKDPRPMDGVFHATYVIARMHQTLMHLLESGVLEAGDQQRALADLEAHRRNFAVGDQVVREGGRLTPLGVEAIESARAYMAAAAAA
jgi:hypothetical protein